VQAASALQKIKENGIRNDPDLAVAVAGLDTMRREERTLELCEAMIDIAAALFNVSGREMRRGGRTTLGVSRVRQIAMYVAHTALGLTMSEVGRGFARDRTTVLHACHLVEDLRDDVEFDRHVVLTERIAMAAFRDRSRV
jgi:chromosomal replication initiation ATPase DnaA